MLRPVAFLTTLCCTVALLVAATASAEDTAYWSNRAGADLGSASLFGTGGSNLVPTPVAAEEPLGSGIDSTTGKIYWGEANADRIMSANLDGTDSAILPTAGAEVNLPNSTVVDVATGRVYWANAEGDTLSWAALNGSGGGNIDTGVAPLEEPFGIAVDPAANRIYWANTAGGTIAYANLDGTGGGGVLPIAPGLLEEPDALAIDTANNRIYWANFEEGAAEGSIGSADLGAGILPITPGLVAEPAGLAIDAGRLYWANEAAAGGIFSAALDGSGGVKLDTAGATISSASSLSVLTKPRAAPQPQNIVIEELGTTLQCPAEPFEPDEVAANLYRAPRVVTYLWYEGREMVDLEMVPGATGATLTPAAPGDYSCQVLGVNEVGAALATRSFTVTAKKTTKTAPTTPAATVLPTTVKLTKVKLDKRHGTATILATVSGPGTLTLTGKNVVRSSVKAAGVGVAKLKVAAKGKALATLRQTGKVKVKAAIKFVATGGAAASVSRAIPLRRQTEH